MLELTRLNSSDYLIFAVYMILMLVIGFVMMRFNEDAEDYFRGGNMMPFWLAGISLFMSGFSAWTFTGGAGVAYLGGTLAFGLYWANAIAYLVGYLVYAVRWRRTRSLTIVEYLSERYDKNVHQFISWANLPIALLQGAIWLFSLSIFFASAAHVNIYWIIILSGAVILLYTMFGGFWAVCMTDTIQFLILMPLALIIFIVSIIYVGGPAALLNKLPTGYWFPYNEAANFTKLYIVINVIAMIYMFNSGGAAQRYFSARDENEAKKIALLAIFLCIIGPVIWIIPPMVSRVVFPDIAKTIQQAGSLGLNSPREASYILISLKLLPHGLIGLLVAGIFAATMSSLSTAYNMFSGVITKDIIGTVFIKDASSKKLHRIGQIVTLLMGVTVIIIALLYTLYKSGGVFEMLIKVNGALGFPIAIPILYGLIYKKTPVWVPYVVIAVGVIQGGIIGFANLEHYFGFELFYVMQISVLSLIYFVPGLLFKPKLSSSPKDRLYARFMLYGAMVFYLAYGYFLYCRLPQENLMWAQSLLQEFYSGKHWIIIYALVGIAFIEVITRLSVKPPNKEYLDRVDRFFLKLKTPVDVKKEISDTFDDTSAHRSSMRILGYVMMGIGSVMYIFLFIQMTPQQKWITVAAATLNLAIGIGLFLLGRRAKIS